MVELLEQFPAETGKGKVVDIRAIGDKGDYSIVTNPVTCPTESTDIRVKDRGGIFTNLF